MKSIVIIGRRWFSRDTGGWHTAQIIIDGKIIATTPKAYGASDQYIQSAAVWLFDHKLIRDFTDIYLNRFCVDHDIRLVTIGVDITRERDL